MTTDWVHRWGYEMATSPSLPGVWRLKEGGFYIRGRARDPRTQQQRNVGQALRDADTAAVAYQTLQQKLRAIRESSGESKHKTIRFSEYAASLMERKITRNELKSQATRETWASILEHHLLPTFGQFLVDQIRRSDVEEWMDSVAVMIKEGEYAPTSANGWLKILRTIVSAFVAEYELPRNPIAGIKDFDTSTHETYTEEEPNSLTAEELRSFLAAMQEHYPQHFAMVALGFATALRPSSMRPLRRKGPTPDVLWDEGKLLVRQSQTRKQVVMRTTKNKKHQRINLPFEVMEILRWHVERLPLGPMRESDLLFPADPSRGRAGGGFRSSSCLDKPFAAVSKIVGLKKHITPRAMRRSWKDLARESAIDNIVEKSISGHITKGTRMDELYETVQAGEQRDAIGKVIELAGLRKQPAQPATDAGDKRKAG